VNFCAVSVRASWHPVFTKQACDRFGAPQCLVCRILRLRA
jgi:hypothetical protein